MSADLQTDLDALGEELARLQRALAFWLPNVPGDNHPLFKRIADDSFLLSGLIGPDDEKSAYEQGFAFLAAPVAPAWQPIETAPKETELLGWRDDCGPLLIMHTSYDRFASEQECEAMDEETLFQKDWFGAGVPGGFERMEGSATPTYWMPLPAAPTGEPL